MPHAVRVGDRHASPPGVGDVTACGATPRTEAPQALIWRGAPRRLRAVPAGRRHRRPSPHPMARAAPGPLAHRSSARRCARQAACQRAAPRAGGERPSRHGGGTAPLGGYADTLPRGHGPPGRCRARVVSGLPPGSALTALDGLPLPACHVLLSRSGSCSSTCAAIIPWDGVACDLCAAQQATVLAGRPS